MASKLRRPKLPRPLRKEAQLRSAVVTICYEYNMFQALATMARRAANAEQTGSVRAMENAILESMLLHARNLRDFLTGLNAKDDDITVYDFLPHAPRYKLTYLRSRSVRNRINKMLAHASFSRPRYPKPWKINLIYQEVSSAWALFLDRLSSYNPNVRRWFSERGH